jgi:hypothetical protein
MQSEELSLQRKELVETRRELRGQKEALEAQTAQQRRTSEATLMERLMEEYDSLAPSVEEVQMFNRSLGADSVERMRAAVHHTGHIDPETYNKYQPARSANESRRNVSRFFVKVRRLATSGFIPDDLVVISLERRAVEMFLSDVDPLDRAVAGPHYSATDRDYYQHLLDNRYSH